MLNALTSMHTRPKCLLHAIMQIVLFGIQCEPLQSIISAVVLLMVCHALVYTLSLLKKLQTLEQNMQGYKWQSSISANGLFYTFLVLLLLPYAFQKGLWAFQDRLKHQMQRWYFSGHWKEVLGVGHWRGQRWHCKVWGRLRDRLGKGANEHYT
jgi:hypothetical protein